MVTLDLWNASETSKLSKKYQAHSCRLKQKQSEKRSRQRINGFIHSNKASNHKVRNLFQNRGKCLSTATASTKVKVAKKRENLSQNEFKKSCKCNLCEKDFSSLRMLYNHNKLMHFERKPYKCFACKRQFNRNSALICHKRLQCLTLINDDG